ncbi:MAG: AlpA family phage regulatory protein [Sphingobacteriales bacterium]|nr:MAG: AlpA family phage regulatory protein [Sphingobacteriales bacterium]
MNYSILRLPKTLEKSGYSRSGLYQRIAEGLWTKPVPIGLRAVGWPDFEVSALNAACIAGKSQAEIKALVNQLHNKRAECLASLLA